METRHVDWEQVGDLTAYLMHLEERTAGFESATSEDKATAHRINDALMEQSFAYIDEDDGTSLAPAYDGAETPYSLAPCDWAFMERWFTNPERMGQWAMESIGSACLEQHPLVGIPPVEGDGVAERRGCHPGNTTHRQRFEPKEPQP